MKINITYMVPGVESVYAINKKKKLDAKSDEKKDNSKKKIILIVFLNLKSKKILKSNLLCYN